ncbi:hypothetical protein LINGRAHAP2_LOCUS13859 [Linum grandiflorum]
MRTQMANLWWPREGITITNKGERLIMFRLPLLSPAGHGFGARMRSMDI